MKLFKEIKDNLISILLFSFMISVFGPMEVYLSNKGYFFFPGTDMLGVVICVFILLIIKPLCATRQIANPVVVLSSMTDSPPRQGRDFADVVECQSRVSARLTANSSFLAGAPTPSNSRQTHAVMRSNARCDLGFAVSFTAYSLRPGPAVGGWGCVIGAWAWS